MSGAGSNTHAETVVLLFTTCHGILASFGTFHSYAKKIAMSVKPGISVPRTCASSQAYLTPPHVRPIMERVVPATIMRFPLHAIISGMEDVYDKMNVQDIEPRELRLDCARRCAHSKEYEDESKSEPDEWQVKI